MSALQPIALHILDEDVLKYYPFSFSFLTTVIVYLCLSATRFPLFSLLLLSSLFLTEYVAPNVDRIVVARSDPRVRYQY